MILNCYIYEDFYSTVYIYISLSNLVYEIIKQKKRFQIEPNKNVYEYISTLTKVSFVIQKRGYSKKNLIKLLAAINV